MPPKNHLKQGESEPRGLGVELEDAEQEAAEREVVLGPSWIPRCPIIPYHERRVGWLSGSYCKSVQSE